MNEYGKLKKAIGDLPMTFFVSKVISIILLLVFNFVSKDPKRIKDCKQSNTHICKYC